MQSSARPASRPLSAVGRHPSAVLLAAQLVVVVLYPFLDQNAAGRSVVGVIQIAIVLAAVWSVRRTPALDWVAIVLGGPAIVLTVAEALHPHTHAVVLASAAFHVPLYFFTSYAMIRYLFEDDVVTRDELFAVGAAFTVVVWGFAYLYAAGQVLWPGSFIGNSSPDGTTDLPWFELLFLSFTTMTNTGLSDIVPIRDHARSLIMLQQICGVFYLGLVVARMMALTSSKSR